MKIGRMHFSGFGKGQKRKGFGKTITVYHGNGKKTTYEKVKRKHNTLIKINSPPSKWPVFDEAKVFEGAETVKIPIN